MKVDLPRCQFTDRVLEHMQELCPADNPRRTFEPAVGRHIARDM